MLGDWSREFVVVLAMFCSPESASSAPLQDAEKTASAVDENFSGTVVQLSAGSFSVERTSWGKESIRHVFVLDADTLIEGKLKAKVRVTVRYKASADGALHAVHIIVRSSRTVSGGGNEFP